MSAIKHTINGSFSGRVFFLCSLLILCLLWLLLICCRRCCGATCCIGCRCTCTRMLLIRRHFQSIYSLWFPLSLFHKFHSIADLSTARSHSSSYVSRINTLTFTLLLLSHSLALCLSLSPSFFYA